jgi:NADH:ubiquinone oxidoreductase subunit 6 (subunit J)
VEQLLFALLALTAVGASVALIGTRNAVYSAMFMVVVFVSTAIMFLMLQAPFMAALQVIVYAGAIVVLFLFVISYLGSRSEGLFENRRSPLVLGVVLGVLLMVELAAAVATLGGFRLGAGESGSGGELAGATAGAAAAAGSEGAVTDGFFGSVESVATLLFTEYVVPFEIVAVLLIVAMVGAVVLAQRVTQGENRS